MSELFPEISIAPMMDLTDHHCRYFLRLISPHVKLYTEMVTANAVIFGDKSKLLRYNPEEQPLAVQLAGSVPEDLAKSAKICEEYGFAEINLNCGCPSDRVQKAKIGACLMAEADLVADCVKAMQDVVDIPVTVKTRIGIDNLDSYEFLVDFISKVNSAGCDKFIIHARKAWLNGLNPKENRTIPELNYPRVFKLKQDMPNLDIILNGGIESVEQIKQVLPHVDGVMIGRAAYYNPYLLAQIEQEIFQSNYVPDRYEIVNQLLPYIHKKLSVGVAWTNLIRHYMGLFKGQPGARIWRQFLSESRDVTLDNLESKFSGILDVMREQERILLLNKSDNFM